MRLDFFGVTRAVWACPPYFNASDFGKSSSTCSRRKFLAQDLLPAGWRAIARTDECPGLPFNFNKWVSDVSRRLGKRTDTTSARATSTTSERLVLEPNTRKPVLGIHTMIQIHNFFLHARVPEKQTSQISGGQRGPSAVAVTAGRPDGSRFRFSEHWIAQVGGQATNSTMHRSAERLATCQFAQNCATRYNTPPQRTQRLQRLAGPEVKEERSEVHQRPP